MKKILVTGSEGFLGKNLCLALKEKGFSLNYFDKKENIQDLESLILGVDFIYHLAGVNRPKEEKEFFEGNHILTKKLIESIASKGMKIPIVYSSSIQAEFDNSYGESKKLAEEELIKYSKENNIPVFIYRLPNLFGKWARPNYNSVVATFCYNISRDLPVSISDEKKEISLAYIDEVVKDFISCIDKISETENENKIIYFDKVYKIKLGDLAEKIKSFKEMRKGLHVPKSSNNLTKYLYSTYISYLPKDTFSIPLVSHKDDRGAFTEFIKTFDSGQVSVSTSKPGITRGNHYHNTKTERFFVLKGKASVKFRDIFDDKIIEYVVSEDEPQFIDIPPGYTHSITNIGDKEMILLLWANEKFDPKNSDTYFLEV